MKHYLKYQSFVVPRKLKIDIRVTVGDTDGVFESTNGDNKSTTVSMYPAVSLSITRPNEMDDNGNRVRAPYNPNDMLGLSKFNFPILVNKLKSIREHMNIQDLYKYHDDRLELNEKVAESIREVFMIGMVTVELSAVVIVQPDDELRVEGIKVKFNNELSTVLLTINELDGLIYNLDHLDIDSIALIMYLKFADKPIHYRNTNIVMNDSDIKAKENTDIDK
jgi:hypothetical protein